jgi:hypothetical protein
MDTERVGDAMTSKPKHSDIQSALRKALITRARELGIDPATLRCPSLSAITARRNDGSLLRLDFGSWPAAELSR